MNYFDFEKKMQLWFATHKFLWCCILFTIGFTLGYVTIHIPKVSLLYGSVLVVIEIFAGGSGNPDTF
jgi:hypothetical protein